MEKIIPYYKDLEEYKKWDTMLTSAVYLELKTEGTYDLEVMYQKYQSPPMIKNRDLALFGVVVKLEDGRWLCSYTSIEDEKKLPLDSNFVRAEVLESGYVLKPIKGEDGQDSTFVTYIVQLDPKGWIPTWAVNATATEQAKVLANMNSSLKERFGDGKSEEKATD